MLEIYNNFYKLYIFVLILKIRILILFETDLITDICFYTQNIDLQIYRLFN